MHPGSTSTLSDWLAWLEQLHPTAIDLGLDRIRTVYRKLTLTSFQHKVFSVAGTNGKGSCARAAEAVAYESGLRVGCYTSPHLWRYNERIRIDMQELDDEQIVSAFCAIDSARGDVSLSYFEFGTLAAIWLFDQADLDLWVMEVGLGGRLDAVNVLDCDVAVVTSIGRDHEAWLGSDLAQIAREKAAICRPDRALLLGAGVPDSAQEFALSRGAQVSYVAVDAELQEFISQNCEGLIAGNIQLALHGIQTLGFEPSSDAIQHGLRSLKLPGRCQLRQIDGCEEILDVAHNTDSVAHLARFVQSRPVVPTTAAVFSALNDKPLAEMIESMAPLVDIWCVAPLGVPRGLSIEDLREALSKQPDVREFETISQARSHALTQAQRVLSFGSFHTVEQAGQ